MTCVLSYGRWRRDRASASASASSGTQTESTATVKYCRRQGVRMNVVLLLVLVTMIDVSVSRASSDFYYDNWQCNHYLSAQSVVVDAAPGHLLELHVRDDIPVSMSNCMLPADSLSRLHLPTYTFAYVLFSSLVDQFLRHDAMHSADYAIARCPSVCRSVWRSV